MKNYKISHFFILWYNRFRKVGKIKMKKTMYIGVMLFVSLILCTGCFDKKEDSKTKPDDFNIKLIKQVNKKGNYFFLVSFLSSFPSSFLPSSFFFSHSSFSLRLAT